MRVGALTLFERTSSPRSFNLAAWHSRHSLTWRWIIYVTRQRVTWPKPFCFVRWRATPFPGFSMGIGQMAAIMAHRNNGGWQLSFSLFWLTFGRHVQRPMWFRDVWQREQNERMRHRPSPFPPPPREPPRPGSWLH